MSLLLGRQRCGFSRLSHQKSVLSYFSSTSSTDDLVLSSVDENAGIAMLTMNRPPANSLSLEMNEAICSSIKNIEANPKIQSVILASSNPKIFSAGLDISELVSPDKDRLPKFWSSLQQVYIDLYGSRLATVAAIQGHAPAAGCFLAMACDYRVMSAGDINSETKKNHVPTIGLNETRLGIAAPFWMGQLLVRTIGFRQAELALAMGTLFPPDQALAVGLVDDVVPRQPCESDNDGFLESVIKDQASNPLMQKAYKQAKIYAKIPPQARVASKLLTRDEHLQDMIAKREEDRTHFCGFVTQEAVQNNLAAYVEALKKKSRKK
eukprot:CAMPEP_0172299972 /NCGR_PEP_ID=MMETSP1058-20130122/2161_1 /TAXON_ID=83371 /ORGANISM="Detonula confervacea, Strain CCMP 353" /LENGTH=321 /DNA_ID=CAMNT_0013009607 /DNA_START=72 /DNA_END=1037 /DNA_ORIENTATION=+